jgi:hypothetical protein
MSPYRIAIDLTTQTIDQRAKHYRNLVVAVVLVTVGSLAWTIIAKQFQALSGLILLFPICGLFFFLDSKLLNHWRSQLFGSWIKKELDFRSFCDAVNAISILPRATLQSMLATLPVANDVVKEQGIASATRKAISALVMAIYACRSDAIAFKTVGFAIGGGAAGLAIVLGTWEPLLGNGALMFLPLLGQRVKLKRIEDAKNSIISVQRHSDFNHEKYLEAVACLDWEPISALEKEGFLAMLSSVAGRSQVSHSNNGTIL